METSSQWTPEWIDLNQVDGSFQFVEGFSRPDWRIIRTAIQQKEPESIDVNGAWNEANIQGFWAGTSFREPGDSNELSYSLAEIAINLIAERGGNWGAFVQQANGADAGQTAAIECLGTDLGDVMATFLGPGNWRPRRKAMVTQWEARRKATEQDADPD